MNQATHAPSVSVSELRLPLASRLASFGELFWLTLRQHTHGRRLVVLVLLLALPCVLAIMLRSLSRPAPADILEFALVFGLIPHALAPLTALLYAAGMIQDEVEGQTLTYLLLRPLPKWTIYLTKWLATLLVCVFLIGFFTFTLYLAIYWGTPQLWTEIVPGRAWKTVVILALAQLGYCSLFGCLGLLFRHTLIAGVAYIVLLEGVIANVAFVGRALTVVYYFRVLILRWLELPDLMQRQWVRAWQLDLATMPAAPKCVETVVVASLAVTIFSAWWFSRSEFALKTPESSG
ncbi:MAG TPA: ABC transporter permease [Gemmataceae bacterium]|nr:ABC transporter permease [Gemmataceae bacterium]